MNFTQHALDKLDLYGISPEEIIEGSESAVHEFYDRNENSKIRIIRVKRILLALVIAPETENLITIYRTDEETINNRRKAERWV